MIRYGGDSKVASWRRLKIGNVTSRGDGLEVSCLLISRSFVAVNNAIRNELTNDLNIFLS